MGSPYRILLVEDDRDLTVAIRMALSGGRWDVEVASSLGEAMEALRVLPAPDVVVTELALYDGPPAGHLLEELAHDPALADVPVVVISAWDRAPAVAAGYGIPAGRVLPKRLDLRRLEATLDACVRGKAPRARLPLRIPVPSNAPHRTGASY